MTRCKHHRKCTGDDLTVVDMSRDLEEKKMHAADVHVM